MKSPVVPKFRLGFLFFLWGGGVRFEEASTPIHIEIIPQMLRA